MSEPKLEAIIDINVQKFQKGLDKVLSKLDKLEQNFENIKKTGVNAFNKAEKATKKVGEELEKLKDKQDKVEKTGVSAFGKFGGAIKAVGSIIATSLIIGFLGKILGYFTDIAKEAINLANKAQESENLFSVSMGNMEESARKWSEELSKALGLNAYEVRKNVATLNVMLGSMGLAEEQAFDMSKSMTQLAYDMSSFYDLPTEEAFNKIRSGISGETEPLKRLGINVQEAAIQQTALNHGIAQNVKHMTMAEKAQARYLTILEQTGKAQGDLERTLGSYTNQGRILGARWNQFMVKIGQMLQPIQGYVKNLIELIDVWIEMINRPEHAGLFKIIYKVIGEILGFLINIVKWTWQLFLAVDNTLGITKTIFQVVKFVYNVIHTIYNILSVGIQIVLKLIWGQIQALINSSKKGVVDVHGLMTNLLKGVSLIIRNVLKAISQGIMELTTQVANLLDAAGNLPFQKHLKSYATAIRVQQQTWGNIGKLMPNFWEEFQKISGQTDSWLNGTNGTSSFQSGLQKGMDNINKNTGKIEKNTRKDSVLQRNFYTAIKKAYEARKNLGNLVGDVERWGQSRSESIGNTFGPRKQVAYNFAINGQNYVLPGPENMTQSELQRRVYELEKALANSGLNK